MSQTTVSAGQSLVDVALQELGSLEALFDLADANGLTITDLIAPGRQLQVPASAAAFPDLVRYYASRRQRVNTGAPLPPLLRKRRDFKANDFLIKDWL
jgi:hypothetical protein